MNEKKYRKRLEFQQNMISRQSEQIDALKAEIEKRGAEVTLMQYPDHHDFSTADLTEIAKRYRALDCSMILTTEKDATRLLNRNDIPGEIRDSIYALPIEVKILNGEEDLFNQNIIDYVTENSRNRGISQGKDDYSTRDCHNSWHRPRQPRERDNRQIRD